MGKRKTKAISVALQGGGSHGAFTWGVLDRLLEEDDLKIKAITATSAGAMNAAAFAAGYARNGKQGARESIERFWRIISNKGAPFSASFWGQAAASSLPFSAYNAGMALTSIASPYEFNPFDLNPLRDALEEAVDFDLVRQAPFDLFLSATDVITGKIKVFKDDEISRDAVLASACLPQTFRAVEIDGQAYWDGGYLGNPSLFPLVYTDAPRDVVMILLNPIARDSIPRRVPEIQDRLNEITFNASLIGELRAIAFVQRLIDDGMLKEAMMKKYRRLNIHAIRGGPILSDLSMKTKYDTNWPFLTELRDKGRAEAERWLQQCARYIGTGESAVNLQKDFLDS
ncbi:MAG: patatin-like phospholipase family protein [Pseudomonadota bacterium]